ncbi:Uncharacterised protein [Bordetella ansorpii]|uniref:Uncharacterized protein n=1 Tax=Bordetella ansorpii TaxID=288768 RepID=A0A157NRG9_9BORD|nr:hypothetical protein [Bordetella ansorpii]SAI23885.1 Uncharacterised protein [Bordetella ansorpii]
MDIGLGAMGSVMARNLAAAHEAAGIGFVPAIGARIWPMLDAAHARMGEAVDAGWGDRDGSAMAKFTSERGGRP